MPTFSFENINFWGILVGAIFNFVLGMFWYGPIFGKVWMENSRWTKKMMAKAQADGMALNFAGTNIQSIIGNVFLAGLLESIHPYYKFTTLEVVLFLTLIFLAFQLPSGLQQFLWEGDKFLYFIINQTNRFATILIPGLFYHSLFLNKA